MPALPKLTLTEILLRASPGDVIYTEVADTAVGSYATRAGVKVKTERLLALHAVKREMTDITRVIVLEASDAPPERKVKSINAAATAARKRMR